ncbi:hypothetical protein ANCCAN_04801 [Ancylostoma caninum]|uniref:Uncharacterized protein n=1 Tax=Ancylostoma caninum TaxID=29170 RepID=A0A368GXH6_ANCCA|nr:hypothetical protein ANCCAN_04801 [Ancylostoma caninum]
MNRRSRITNSTLYLSEAIQAQEETNPLHELHSKKLIRYDFGASFSNYCKLKAVPYGWLPSIPRTLEMKIAPQAWLRLAVLLGLNIKFVLCMVRNESILVYCQGLGYTRLVCRLQPVMELLSSAVLAVMTCLHQEQDKSVKWLMTYNFPVFSCLFVLEGLMSLSLDPLNSRFSAVFFNIKLGCLIAFSVCAGTAQTTFQEYLEERPCHTYVPFRSAIAEYICVASLLVFSATQLGDLRGLRIVVPSLADDQAASCSAAYSPAFLALQSTTLSLKKAVALSSS